MSTNLQRLQVLQNDMLRVIHGKKRSDHLNMTKLRRDLKVFSVNQLTCYHVLVENFNIVKFKSVEHLHNKMVPSESDNDDRQTDKEHGKRRSDSAKETKGLLPGLLMVCAKAVEHATNSNQRH